MNSAIHNDDSRIIAVKKVLKVSGVKTLFRSDILEDWYENFYYLTLDIAVKH
ncbi:hypothetical protein [Arsenophonus nasoniae]|uniref:Uncharacterized protein n=1 Tax=Arsenophonus nasoniae TaxID=638 RepID=D2TZ18_9GAMM|nr:hypothetical protein [Arsenophonus nasoniae]CBA72770.1 hypothetical protein ARN_14110 [Arsenophonus nasoniae]